MSQTIIKTKLDQVRGLIDRGFVYFDFEQILEVHYRRWIRPGDTVIDIGAHIGRHLGPMLDMIGPTGKALAFEPIPSVFSELKSRFCDKNVIFNNVALADRNGTADFIFAEGAAEESGLKKRKFNSPETTHPKTINVPVCTLDSFTKEFSSVSFIKIDIEGGEIDCLKGASSTISRFRPLISVEYGDLTYTAYGNNADTLFRFASENSYVIYDMFMNKLDDIDEWRSSLNYVYWDFFLVPVEKEQDFKLMVVSLPDEKLPDPRTVMNELKEAEKRIAEANEIINNMINSSSWKVTAPIRRIMSALRR
ncbi:methyltransferase FkbM family [Dickeya parazeae Ech586]|uniref:Methyltransferase FkbM family n=1 Tax=Dickeya zeae (strain Ech586) TaxID=590409 RepID=D2BXW0_DICZ5|nr:FkbM family methyltransferase [Dickeya parazeae]ACZ76564.1 methyltransferase FkbM family [Dickeya parazeae Ech586]